jgi:hypothetical protein
MSMQSAVQHISSSIGAIGAAQILATEPDTKRLLHVPTLVAISACVGVLLPFLMWRVEKLVKARTARAAADAAARNDIGAAEAAPVL